MELEAINRLERETGPFKMRGTEPWCEGGLRPPEAEHCKESQAHGCSQCCAFNSSKGVEDMKARSELDDALFAVGEVPRADMDFVSRFDHVAALAAAYERGAREFAEWIDGEDIFGDWGTELLSEWLASRGTVPATADNEHKKEGTK